MSLNIVQVTITKGTAEANKIDTFFQLPEPYIRWISARTNAPTATISFRLSHNSNTLAPVPGIGLANWVLMLGNVDWDEFRKLSGPTYELLLESFNVDSTTDYVLQLLIETSKTPFYPVNVLSDPGAPVMRQPTTGTSGT